MRWLALHLPELPLNVYDRALEQTGPLAVSQHGRVACVLRCNGTARTRGVRNGMSVSAARTLVADLRVLPRRPGSERAALERLACWCGTFTPEVSLEPPDALVMDVAASLRLFNGPDTLLERVITGVRELGYSGTGCLAPTPKGALILAAQRRCQVIDDLDHLRSALSDLPLVALGLDGRQGEDLWRMGLRRVGDLLHLPRGGLSLRLGPEWVRMLESVLGERPEPRLRFEPPPCYVGRLELPVEVQEAAALVFACRRLLEELGGMLRARQCGVQQLVWRLRHADMPATEIVVGAVRPESDPVRWLDLLRERLERERLPAPVRAISLAARDFQLLQPVMDDLFPELVRAADSFSETAFLDRLRARLGDSAVRGLAPASDHRPERAWRWCGLGEDVGGTGRSDRPLWLLPKPLALRTRGPRPWWDGPLDLGGERERIETGWWDGFEVARDYFVATTERGERLWVYRDIGGARGWFLHGVFG